MIEKKGLKTLNNIPSKNNCLKLKKNITGWIPTDMIYSDINNTK